MRRGLACCSQQVTGAAASATFGFKGKINWFPGHMHKALKVMREQVRKCDMVVELRDARIPFTSANPILDQVIGNKPRLIAFNKADLADAGSNRRLARFMSSPGSRTSVMFTSMLRGSKSIRSVVQWAAQNSSAKFKTAGSLIMVVGMPNVGKSTLINALRSRFCTDARVQEKKVAKTGATPGVTRNLQSFKISESPLVYMMDTPGVMVPDVSCPEAGLKLALTGGIRDEVVGEELLTEYLLFCLTTKMSSTGPYGLKTCLRTLGLRQAPVTIEEMVEAVYRQSGAMGKEEGEGRVLACRYLLKLFREGRLGKVTLDDVQNNSPMTSRSTSRARNDGAHHGHSSSSSSSSIGRAWT